MIEFIFLAGMWINTQHIIALKDYAAHIATSIMDALQVDKVEEVAMTVEE